MPENPIYDAVERNILHPVTATVEQDLATARTQWHELSDWFTRNHGASQAPAATPVNVETATTLEDPMSLLDTIKNDVAAVEAKLEGVDEAALGKLNAVMAHPEASAVLNDLAGLASIVGIPEGTITGVATGLKTVLSLYAQPAQAPVAPAPAA